MLLFAIEMLVSPVRCRRLWRRPVWRMGMISWRGQKKGQLLPPTPLPGLPRLPQNAIIQTNQHRIHQDQEDDSNHCKHPDKTRDLPKIPGVHISSSSRSGSSPPPIQTTNHYGKRNYASPSHSFLYRSWDTVWGLGYFSFFSKRGERRLSSCLISILLLILLLLLILRSPLLPILLLRKETIGHRMFLRFIPRRFHPWLILLASLRSGLLRRRRRRLLISCQWQCHPPPHLPSTKHSSLSQLMQF
mmetsp:Transcript_1486/g.2681  ORF Transcript_1486/g.2681 Transcript_1486/m.2681 type:complete len:245 (-) Transcript_1486:1700-2434(-)